ncbi:MAG: hypothetical protein V7727_17765, partial [Sneathiella sp.]
MTNEENAFAPANSSQKSTSFKMTVSRKILGIVLATFIVGISLLVYFGNENQRQDMENLAISNNLTITQLMAVQMSGGLRWKKAPKITEVYKDMA